MMNKANLLATVAGTIVMFFLGYMVWGILTADFFQTHSLAQVGKDPMNISYVFLGNLVATFAISSLYGKWANGTHSAFGGFKFGALTGLLIGVGLGLLWFGTTNLMDLTGHLAEAGIDILFYGVIGAVIAVVYKMVSSRQAVA